MPGCAVGVLAFRDPETEEISGPKERDTFCPESFVGKRGALPNFGTSFPRFKVRWVPCGRRGEP
eukprot:4447234-Heterocapsa_arctica.AAC.1